MKAPDGDFIGINWRHFQENVPGCGGILSQNPWSNVHSKFSDVWCTRWQKMSWQQEWVRKRSPVQKYFEDANTKFRTTKKGDFCDPSPWHIENAIVSCSNSIVKVWGWKTLTALPHFQQESKLDSWIFSAPKFHVKEEYERNEIVLFYEIWPPAMNECNRDSSIGSMIPLTATPWVTLRSENVLLRVVLMVVGVVKPGDRKHCQVFACTTILPLNELLEIIIVIQVVFEQINNFWEGKKRTLDSQFLVSILGSLRRLTSKKLFSCDHNFRNCYSYRQWIRNSRQQKHSPRIQLNVHFPCSYAHSGNQKSIED